MTTLLDANVLIALTHDSHTDHQRARIWFSRLNDAFATCPSTQGSLLRQVYRHTPNPVAAKAALASITDLPGHEFWPDSISYGDVRMEGIIGHRQVTDTYLAQLARANNGRLATFDRGLAALHTDVAELIPDIS